jgi:hypothetical protein
MWGKGLGMGNESMGNGNGKVNGQSMVNGQGQWDSPLPLRL